ncbi:hypothetical protein BC830DRAFT_1134035 [Chytriomyces sp. MP71]|nr:hypothetical protein BC830DRAFT_1134035 [Chytriomyces sp. MP71]
MWYRWGRLVLWDLHALWELGILAMLVHLSLSCSTIPNQANRPQKRVTRHPRHIPIASTLQPASHPAFASCFLIVLSLSPCFSLVCGSTSSDIPVLPGFLPTSASVNKHGPYRPLG